MCVVHDISHQDGIDYIVMELVIDRPPLRARVARTGGAPGGEL